MPSVPPSSLRSARTSARIVRRASALILGLFASCASTPSRGAGEALRVTLIDYTEGTRFELVSRTHTDPVAYYSQPRNDASRKIVDDEVAGALVDYLQEQGFTNFSQPGSAPAGGSGRWTRGLEFEGPEGMAHLVTGAGSPNEERQVMVNCTVTFLALYQEAQSFQAIENTSGSAFFQNTESR